MAEQQDELQPAAETPLPEACPPAATHSGHALADSFHMSFMPTHLQISQFEAPCCDRYTCLYHFLRTEACCMHDNLCLQIV